MDGLVQELVSESPVLERGCCFVVECTGSRRLGRKIGLPLSLVCVAADAGRRVRELNRSRHGSATIWPGGFMPFRTEDGWDDWSVCPLENLEFDGACSGLAQVDGALTFQLPLHVSLEDIAGQVSAALRQKRLQDVVTRPDWLEARSAAAAELVVLPRYTPSPFDDVGGATLVTDLVTFDAVTDAARLAWLLVGAHIAAKDRRRPWWP